MDLVELKRRIARVGFELETELQEENQFLEIQDQRGRRIHISASEAEYEVSNRLDKWLRKGN